MKRSIGLVALFIAAVGCGSGSSATLGAPTNLAAAPLSGGLHLTWTDNSKGETMFMIERKDPGKQFVEAYSVPFDITQYHDAQVTIGSTYTYRVRAMSDSSMSDYSNEATMMAK